MWKWMFILCLASTVYLNAEARVLAFAGSTRQDSDNKKLVLEAARIAKELGAEVTVIDLRDYPIPFYDGDLEVKEGMPLNAKQLRKFMISSDVILIASPNYNGSLSGVLKNALDWASRKEEGGSSREAFKGKKFAIMSASPGKTGGSKGLGHLRSIIENIGGSVAPQQVSIPQSNEAFDEQGQLKNPELKAQLEQLVKSVLE